MFVVLLSLSHIQSKKVTGWTLSQKVALKAILPTIIYLDKKVKKVQEIASLCFYGFLTTGLENPKTKLSGPMLTGMHLP